MRFSLPRLAGLIVAGSLILSLPAIAAPTLSTTLTLTPGATDAAHIGYFPIPIALSSTRLPGITKEPAYKSAPRYGVIHLGNGPNSAYTLALDEPEGGDFKVYLDKNRNGDLTDDGDGAWSAKNSGNGRTVYGPNQYTLRASYGSPTHETTSGSYSVGIYRIVGIAPLLMYRTAARVGSLTVGGKPHHALLIENDADALYSKPLDDAGKPMAGQPLTHPVWLFLDANNDDRFGQPIDVRSPFKLGNQAYVANVAVDGSTLTLVPTTRKVPEPPTEAGAKPLLKPGTPAPDFVAQAWGGGNVHLSDFKGKVVVLDFWATWCGPCQASMPHIEKVYQAVKGQNVAVLGLCVWDEKAAYSKWVPQHQDAFHFKLAYDPAGNSPKNVAASLFNVSGIPTTYIIDKRGKVADAIVGYSDGDTRLEAALKKLGVTVK